MSKNLSRIFLNTIDKNSSLEIIGSKINNKWSSTDRKQLLYMVNYCSEILKERGINKGDRVSYKGKNSIEFIAWNLATYNLGGIWVPMYSDQNKNYCQYIINDCNPKLLITDDTIEIKNTEIISNKIIPIENSEPIVYDSNDIASLIYTSGTTGNPKGVMLSHENIISNLEAIDRRFKDIEKIKSLNILPWAHIYSLTCELYYNLMYDNFTYISTGKDNFINECRETNPNVLYIVPKLLELVKKKVEILDKPLIKLILPRVINYIFGNNLLNVFIGGAKLDENTKQFYLDNQILICEGYGCTETAPMVSVNHLYEPRDEESIGKILDNVKVKIINNEICVSGPNVMEGYWNNKLATQNSILLLDNKKWYKTGDSGYVKDNFLYYKGRISENYKLSNGKFVNIVTVEGTVRKYLKSNFIVYGDNLEYNILISDEVVSNKTLKLINKELESYLRIKEVVLISQDNMKNFLTPKMSIKRKKLVNYISDNHLSKLIK